MFKQINDHKSWFHSSSCIQSALERIQRNRIHEYLSLHKPGQTEWSCLSQWANLLPAANHQPENWNCSVSARFFIAALRVSVSLLVTGWSILGRKLFLILRAPAERRAPISRSMLELASGLLVSMWMNSAAVRVLWLFQTCVSFYRTRKNGVCPEYYASYFLLCRRLSFSSRR